MKRSPIRPVRSGIRERKEGRIVHSQLSIINFVPSSPRRKERRPSGRRSLSLFPLPDALQDAAALTEGGEVAEGHGADAEEAAELDPLLDGALVVVPDGAAAGEEVVLGVAVGLVVPVF